MAQLLYMNCYLTILNFNISESK